jgi:hypothetical protein
MTKHLEDVDPRWRGLIRLSGILFIISGVGGIIVSRLSGMLYASGTPTTAEGYLQLFSQHQLLAAADWGLWCGGFVLIPASIAMYLVLRRINNSLALVGSILSVMYVIFDICVTELNSLTLVSLSQGYASATTDALRAPYVAAATYGVAALPVQTFFSFTIGAVGWLFWSLIMWKGVFPRWTAIFGIIVNVMGILGGVGALVQGTPFYLLGLFTIFGALFTAFWFIVIGAQLYRYGNRLPIDGVKV